MLDANSLIILLFLTLPLAAMLLGIMSIQNPRERKPSQSIFSPTRINEYTAFKQMLKR
jgi:hypothetical protein